MPGIALPDAIEVRTPARNNDFFISLSFFFSHVIQTLFFSSRQDTTPPHSCTFARFCSGHEAKLQYL
jgi:hypothetical protein